jgi:hypothetical protein
MSDTNVGAEQPPPHGEGTGGQSRSITPAAMPPFTVQRIVRREFPGGTEPSTPSLHWVQTMSRTDDLATFGREIAAAQGVLDVRSHGDWLAYGQACHDALARRRPLPILRPASPPPSPPRSPSLKGAAPSTAAPWQVEARRGRSRPTQRRATNIRRPRPTDPSHREPVSSSAKARQVEARLPTRHSWLPNIVWGLMWRYGVLGALVVAAQLQAQKPWLLIAGVLLGGLFLGLWRRRWTLARLWRTVVVAGGAVYIAPLFSLYPDALVGSIGALTLAPLAATWRRR